MRMSRRSGLLRKAGPKFFNVILCNANFGAEEPLGEYSPGDIVEVSAETILGPVNCVFSYIEPNIPYEDGGETVTFTMPASNVTVYYE